MKDISADVAYINELQVKALFEQSISTLIQGQNPSNSCSITTLQSIRRSWAAAGSIVVFTAGVFDILHTSHLLALTHYRLLGAHEYLHRQNIEQPSIELLQEVAASSKVRFMLSVDTDERVTSDKAFVPSKGNSPKPLVSWENRTLLLAHQAMKTKNGSHSLIDYITSHGQDACTCDDCPRYDNAYIAASIKPDVIIVSSGSPTTIEKLYSKKDELPDTKLIIIEENALAYYDKLLQGPIKSSSIIKRAQLKPVLAPKGSTNV